VVATGPTWLGRLAWPSRCFPAGCRWLRCRARQRRRAQGASTSSSRPMSRAALRPNSLARSNNCQGESFRCGLLLSGTRRSHRNDVRSCCRLRAVIVGFNTSMASGAKKGGPICNGVGRAATTKVILQAAGRTFPVGDGGLYSSQTIGLSNPAVKARCGRFQKKNIGKTAVAGCYITSGKLQRNLQRPGASRQTGGLRGRPRLPASPTRTTSKRWPPFRVRQSAAIVFAKLGKDKDRRRGLTSFGHQRRHPEGTTETP